MPLAGLPAATSSSLESPPLGDDGAELPALVIPPTGLGVVGVSGGCGETVLAKLLADTQPGGGYEVAATDHRWPAGGAGGQPVVLCARTTMASMEAAQRA